MNIDRYMELFEGRPDVFARQNEDGTYLPIRRPLDPEDVAAHLGGDWTIGIYTTRPGTNDCKLLVFDIDTRSTVPALSIIDVLHAHGVYSSQYLVEFSGRKGHHVWLFLDRWEPAAEVRQAGMAVLQQAGIKCEVFPKQGEVGDGFGNLVKLPLGRHRVSGQESRFIAGCHPWELVRPISADQLDNLIDSYQKDPPKKLPATFNRQWKSSIFRFLETAEAGNRNNFLFRAARWLLDEGGSEEDFSHLNDIAVSLGLPQREVDRTIASAMKGR